MCRILRTCSLQGTSSLSERSGKVLVTLCLSVCFKSNYPKNKVSGELSAEVMGKYTSYEYLSGNDNITQTF
jgi:hypothetical protein